MRREKVYQGNGGYSVPDPLEADKCSWNRDFGDCPRTKFKKQNWCGICAHSELEKFRRESEAIQREKSKEKRQDQYSKLSCLGFSL